MLEDVQKILTSKKERFPEEGWNRLKELSRKLEAGEITESAFEARVWAIADFYDNIKQKQARSLNGKPDCNNGGQWSGQDLCNKKP